ncbi:hypothetical protein TRVL_03022 [Trypanosoma vivax]|nr:hypothetical protein TRVL_03022 [Trypanosoma vivax]
MLCLWHNCHDGRSIRLIILCSTKQGIAQWEGARNSLVRHLVELLNPPLLLGSQRTAVHASARWITRRRYFTFGWSTVTQLHHEAPVVTNASHLVAFIAAHIDSLLSLTTPSLVTRAFLRYYVSARCTEGLHTCNKALSTKFPKLTRSAIGFSITNFHDPSA